MGHSKVRRSAPSATPLRGIIAMIFGLVLARVYRVETARIIGETIDYSLADIHNDPLRHGWRRLVVRQGVEQQRAALFPFQGENAGAQNISVSVRSVRPPRQTHRKRRQQRVNG